MKVQQYEWKDGPGGSRRHGMRLEVCYYSSSHLQYGTPMLGPKGNWQSQVSRLVQKERKIGAFWFNKSSPLKQWDFLMGTLLFDNPE